MRVLSSVWFWFSGIFSFILFAIPAIPSGTKGSIQFAHYWSRLLLKINFIKTQKLSETSYEPGIVSVTTHSREKRAILGNSTNSLISIYSIA
jgi:hypothetical protein